MKRQTDRSSGFAELGLDPLVVDSAVRAGLSRPTVLQRQMIPPFLAGRDILAEASSGAGKTAAYLLPMLQRVKLAAGLQSLILVPDDRLAQRVTRALQRLSAPCGVTCCHLSSDVAAGSNGSVPEIVVTTAEAGASRFERIGLPLGRVNLVVLDELDRILAAGQRDHVEHILRQVNPGRQVVACVAVVDAAVRQVTDPWMRDPVQLIGGSGPRSPDGEPAGSAQAPAPGPVAAPKPAVSSRFLQPVFGPIKLPGFKGRLPRKTLGSKFWPARRRRPGPIAGDSPGVT